MTDIKVVSADDAPIVPLIDDAAPPKVRVRRRGRVTKWLAIGWLVFIVVSAIGAESLPYLNHSCDQFDSKSECVTGTGTNIRYSERPPSWAVFSDSPQAGEPERFGLMGTDKNGRDLFARSMLGGRLLPRLGRCRHREPDQCDAVVSCVAAGDLLRDVFQ